MVGQSLLLGCVISSFITKPQPYAKGVCFLAGCVISSFITKPQLAGTDKAGDSCCVISSFITKPQLHAYLYTFCVCCVISSFITKPQPRLYCPYAWSCCVISSFITKPQPAPLANISASVALYPLSSPNHNLSYLWMLLLLVALYPLSSPNHNILRACAFRARVALYPLSSPNHNHVVDSAIYQTLRYILFHHQTTTAPLGVHPFSCCVISSFITKPQLRRCSLNIRTSCVISSFITKPQLFHARAALRFVALYPLSSPNHNLLRLVVNLSLLRYILFHHQTTTRMVNINLPLGCVISSFITKPQLPRKRTLRDQRCVISSFITKPQPCMCSRIPSWCCVISSFITKPQPIEGDNYVDHVALYPLSSPNHNYVYFKAVGLKLRYILFHHQTTTKTKTLTILLRCVISSFITKPQRLMIYGAYRGVALYPLSSPNHN